MESIKISIITVVYNDVKNIENTILSVINQSYTNKEYIIIDGGSTDGTVEIIKKYNSHIDYWISEADKGVYDAMNKGILKSSGDWLHFRNSGDLFYCRDVISEIFSSHYNSDIDIIHGACRFWDKDGYRDAEPNILSRTFQKRMPFFHPSTFVRTELHKRYLFDISYKSNADYDFFYRCLEQNIKHVYVHYIISIFDLNEGISTNVRLKLKENYKIRNKKKKFNILSKLNTELSIIGLNIKNYALSLPFGVFRKIKIKRKRKHNWIITPVSSPIELIGTTNQICINEKINKPQI